MVCDQKKCTGCGLCLVKCPRKAIIMKEATDGFLYPSIDKSKCVNCNLCKKNCPILANDKNNNYDKPKFIYGWSKNKKTVQSSSSGGIFPELAKFFLKNNDLVVGCTQKNNTFYHILLDNIDNLKEILGSKYVQSDIVNIYLPIIDNLKKGKKILFCGCPCQVAAVKKSVPPELQVNLYTIDLICHGVPSNSFFKKHISEMELKYGEKVIYTDFRYNKKEWRKYFIKYKLESGKEVIKLAIEDAFMACFLKESIYREACYNCNFNKIPRMGDITLGDYSGINKSKVTKENLINGISSCLVNNSKGNDLISFIEKNIILQEDKIDNLIKTNHNINSATKYNAKRDKILRSAEKVSKLSKRYCQYPVLYKLSNHIFSIDQQNKIYNLIKKGRKQL